MGGPTDSRYSNVISMALWGDNPLYVEGLRENVRRFEDTYGTYWGPGVWTLRVYVDRDLELRYLDGVELIQMDRGDHPYPVWWRLLAIDDPNVTYCCFRDADSRFTIREVLAVTAWMKSGKSAHVMRDNVAHEPYAILGGMWGVFGPLYRWAGLTGLLDFEWWRAPKPIDSQMLSKHVWPVIKDQCVQHVRDPGHDRFGGGPFPDECPDTPDEYVGRVVMPGEACNDDPWRDAHCRCGAVDDG